MWIERVRADGFGRIVGGEFEFANGLNCVYGANEAGKTTLLEFLISMLYGQARPALKKRELDQKNDLYRPWRTSLYGGELLVCLRSGRKLFVRRWFDGKADRIELTDDDTGKSELSRYPRDRTREYRFVREETQVDKKTFTGVFALRHDTASELGDTGRLSARLAPRKPEPEVRE